MIFFTYLTSVSSDCLLSLNGISVGLALVFVQENITLLILNGVCFSEGKKQREKNIKMSIKYSEVDSEYREKIDKLFGVANCFIEVDPGKFLIPPKFKELGERILGLEVRPNDVWLASYPRTGM